MKEYCRVCGTNEAAEGKLVRIPDEYSFDGYKYVPACEDCYSMVGPNYRKSTEVEKPKKMVKKISMFASDDAIALQNIVNAFIKDKNVIDIKFNSFMINDGSRISVNDRFVVIYEVEE